MDLRLESHDPLALFGPFKLDQRWRLWRDGAIVRVTNRRTGKPSRPPGQTPFKILLLLIDAGSTGLRASDLRRIIAAVDIGERQQRLRSHINILRTHLEDSLPPNSVYIDTARKPSGEDETETRYEFIASAQITPLGRRALETLRKTSGMSLPIISISTRRTADPSHDQPSREFSLSVDGIILNSYAEITFGTIPEIALKSSRLLYINSLYDFSFALAYARNITSNWVPPRHGGRNEPNDAASQLVSIIPNDIFHLDSGDPSISGGAVLSNDRWRARVSEYIAALGEAIRSDADNMTICREWLLRDAHLYLGDHKSLFEEQKHSADYIFAKEYYQDNLILQIPALMGGDLINRLAGYLPKYPRGHSKDRYSAGALRHFVLCCILTHITIMHQYELRCGGATRRMPFVLRGIVKKQWNNCHFNQRKLRKLVVGAALHRALEELQGTEGRKGLVEALVGIRKLEEFSIIRDWLEELDLLAMDPNPESERKAEELVDAINSSGKRSRYPHGVLITQKDLIRHEVIGKITWPRASSNRERFLKLFPELVT